MRSKISVLLLVGVLVCLVALPTLIQAQEQKSQLYLLWEVKVKSKMAKEHGDIIKEMVAKDTKYNLGYEYRTYYDNHLHTYFSLPLDNYGDLDSYLAAWNKVGEKWGMDKTKDLYQRISETYESMKTAFYLYRPELSYRPENPRLKSEEIMMGFWDFLYVKPDKEKDIEDLFKEFVALCKSKDISEKIRVFTGDMGTEMPVYLALVYARDPAGFYSNHRRMWEALGEEGSVLYQKVIPLLRKRESRIMWYSRDLSYTPKER
jgi:hypothetical protein